MLLSQKLANRTWWSVFEGEFGLLTIHLKPYKVFLFNKTKFAWEEFGSYNINNRIAGLNHVHHWDKYWRPTWQLVDVKAQLTLLLVCHRLTIIFVVAVERIDTRVVGFCCLWSPLFFRQTRWSLSSLGRSFWHRIRFLHTVVRSSRDHGGGVRRWRWKRRRGLRKRSSRRDGRWRRKRVCRFIFFFFVFLLFLLLFAGLPQMLLI